MTKKKASKKSTSKDAPVKRPKPSEYRLTKEHEALMPEHVEYWRSVSRRVSPQTMEERKQLREQYIPAVYTGADFKTVPHPERIIFMPSPLTMSFAGGFAAWVWHCRGSISNYDKQVAEGKSLTKAQQEEYDSLKPFSLIGLTPNKKDPTGYSYTPIPDWDGMNYAEKAIIDGFNLLIRRDEDIASGAGRSTTNGVIDPVGFLPPGRDNLKETHKEYFTMPLDYMTLCRKTGTAQFGLAFAEQSNRMGHAGNQWACTASIISFLRDVANVDADFTQWAPYEEIVKMSGPLMFGELFTISCDFPYVVSLNEDNEPHNNDGPHAAWKDGSAIYSVEGVKVPGWVVEDKNLITVKDIKETQDMEVQRIMREFYGDSRYLRDIGATLIAVDLVACNKADTSNPRTITRALLRDDEGHQWMVGSDGSTDRVYTMRVSDTAKTCVEAHNSISPIKDEKILYQA